MLRNSIFVRSSNITGNGACYCRTAAAAAPALLKLHVYSIRVTWGLLLLFVMVCRMTHLLLCFLAPESSVFFFLFKHDLFLTYPFGSAVACTGSIAL